MARTGGRREARRPGGEEDEAGNYQGFDPHPSRHYDGEPPGTTHMGITTRWRICVFEGEERDGHKKQNP